METGYDILFFWVARMIMTSLLFTNDIPFHTVYLHGLIRDDQGRKMSKTTGNVIDPLHVIDGARPEQLGEYVRQQYPNGMPAMGTDALRFTLLTSGTPGNDLNLSLQRVEANRNFANKIWNAARFVIMNLDIGYQRLDIGLISHIQYSLPDRWILSRLNHLIATMDRLFAAYQYGEAGRQAYEFLWGEYCDWYLEMAKIVLSGEDQAARERTQAVLVHVLDQTLRLLHPFIPFVTEEIWQHLKRAAGAESWPEALMIARWPEVDESRIDPQAEVDMGLIMDLIRAIRNARAEYRVEPGRRIPAIFSADGRRPLLESQAPVLSTLARLDPKGMRIEEHLAEAPRQSVTLVVGGVTCYLPLAGLVDLDRERERLGKELAGLEGAISRSERLLADEKFMARAPEHVVRRERDKLEDLRAQRQKLVEQLKRLHDKE